jgi:hypothetical protein
VKEEMIQHAFVEMMKTGKPPTGDRLAALQTLRDK